MGIGAGCGSTATKPAPNVVFPPGEGGANADNQAGQAGTEEAGQGGAGAVSSAAAGAGTSEGGAGGATDSGNEGGAAGASGAPGDSCRRRLAVVFRDFKPYGVPGGQDDFEASARGVKCSISAWSRRSCSPC